MVATLEPIMGAKKTKQDPSVKVPEGILDMIRVIAAFQNVGITEYVVSIIEDRIIKDYDAVAKQILEAKKKREG